MLTNSSAYATNVSVDCDKPRKDDDAKKKQSITAALAKLSKQGPHTITVSGTCNENVTIEEFDNLTLIARPGASINDPVSDDLINALNIFGTRIVTLDGFIINAAGELNAVTCGVFSSCRLFNNTIRGASDFAVFIGRHSSAELLNTTIQDSGGGLLVTFGGDAVLFDGAITGITGGPAVDVSLGSLLRIQNVEGPPVQIQYDGVGVSVTENSTLRLQPGAARISGRGGPGIQVDWGSVVWIRGQNVIENDGVNGITVGESSFVFIADAVEISGNTGDAVKCSGTFSNAKGKFPCNNP